MDSSDSDARSPSEAGYSNTSELAELNELLASSVLTRLTTIRSAPEDLKGLIGT